MQLDEPNKVHAGLIRWKIMENNLMIAKSVNTMKT